MSAKPYLRAKHEQIVKLASDGVPASRIASLLDVCVSGVRKYCKRNDIELVDVKNEFPKVADTFAEAATANPIARELAQQFNVTDTTIRRWAKLVSVELQDKFHKGYVITDNGYKMLLAKQHPSADSKGYVREHVLVMEAHLGRYLAPEECVHHKDRNKLNNAIDNLELMTRSEHAALHAREGDTGWSVYHERNKI